MVSKMVWRNGTRTSFCNNPTGKNGSTFSDVNMLLSETFHLNDPRNRVPFTFQPVLRKLLVNDKQTHLLHFQPYLQRDGVSFYTETVLSVGNEVLKTELIRWQDWPPEKIRNIIFGSWGHLLIWLKRIYNAAGCDPCCCAADIIVWPVFRIKKLTDSKFKVTNVLGQSPIFRPRKRVSFLKLNRVAKWRVMAWFDGLSGTPLHKPPFSGFPPRVCRPLALTKPLFEYLWPV